MEWECFVLFLQSLGQKMCTEEHRTCIPVFEYANVPRLKRGRIMKSTALGVVLVALAGLNLSACASVIKGGSASVAVTTPPISGANCVLSSPEGSWQLVSPSSVTVSRSKHDIQVRCTKDGYQDAAAVIPSSFEGWTLGNIILGGIIGVGVDAATGAMNDYPNAFQVPMVKLDAADTTPPTLAPTPTMAPIADPADGKAN